MRVGELQTLTWGDVDEHGLRFRVKTGKTAAARRWVALPEWLMQELSETCPREDRTSERRVFAGFSPDVAKNVMARACKTAGIVHRHPHDLRHRYASVKIADGVPVTQVAAQLGHSRKSLTLDTLLARPCRGRGGELAPRCPSREGFKQGASGYTGPARWLSLTALRIPFVPLRLSPPT
jgi:integrase